MLSKKDRYIARRENCRKIVKQIEGNPRLAGQPSTMEQLRAVIFYFGLTLANTGGFCCDWTPEIDDGMPMQRWIGEHANEIMQELERVDRIRNCGYLRVEK